MTTPRQITQLQVYRKIGMGFGLAFFITLFIQFSDYIKSYILYIRAKKTLITMYHKGASVAEMNDQADIVEYLQKMAVDAIQQIFFMTATFAFIAGIVILVVLLGRKVSGGQ